MATPSNSWAAPSPHPPAAQPSGADELALQVRPMGLKVHYSFDRENQVHCLAKWAQILPIQTLPLDDTRTIGVVDLRTCLLAVSQSSPEMLNQQENDYSVYAYDYSEQDVPLVGQGLLSWAMDSRREPQQQLVTGRVTRNNLAALTNGSRDTLEVKLKFAAVARMPQRTDAPSMEPVNGQHRTSIPADTASEWNSFVQSNPMLGHTSNHTPSKCTPADDDATSKQGFQCRANSSAAFMFYRKRAITSCSARCGTCGPGSSLETCIEVSEQQAHRKASRPAQETASRNRQHVGS
ncbi:hypothetical protein NEMBOFW57_005356 [Staphylotrichum longicolle]|uniref:Ams2/SPT21 N-terminal domain-containing protein n=1 Tax=Staphylotrichum longicolle TaxID=669026 RepID=A0AAD4EXJ9_9PEZI|nr:hypothetical protein NEMBOFW57_005356 [Staphylotrichum longicolle]